MKKTANGFTYSSEYFNIADTLECGQVFRYKKLGEQHYEVRSLDKYAELKQVGDQVEVTTDSSEYFYKYFDLYTDYSEIYKTLSKKGDETLTNAAKEGKGIRILRQDHVEATINFIISANNNIKRIQQIIERICEGCGEQTEHGYAFPTLEALSQMSEKFFEKCGAGYRAKYLVETSNYLVQERYFFYDVTDNYFAGKTKDDKIRNKLMTLKGVGPKVADCILLFGFHRLDAFPVDTWVKKIYHNYYEQGHKDSEIADYMREYFGEYAGLCQQYLFYYQRKHRQKKKNTVK